MSPTIQELLKKKYTFHWDVLDIIIGGKSSIDSHQGFHLTSLEEAKYFIESYGYNTENPIESAQLFGNFHESLNFIRKYFLQPENPEGLKIEVPRRILELTDIRELFLFASMTAPNQNSDVDGYYLRAWACSILKVMHTVAHIDQDLRSQYFTEVQQQIFDRFYKYIHRDSSGNLYLGENEEDILRVDLTAFETKPKKSRDSILIKLLHKPENVAEDIFDRVGIRFITPTLLDAVRVVKFLKDKMVIMPPNIKPSRSRNTLLDMDDFRSGIIEMQSAFTFSSQLNPYQSEDKVKTLHHTIEQQIVSILNQATHSPKVNPENPHSSEFYRSIQFTSRQLIKLINPLYNDIRELKNFSKSNDTPASLHTIIDRIDLKYIQKEVRFFYPYEVQVVDIKSHTENELGRSAHSEYKKSQLATALKRVMASLIDFQH